uniref:CAP-Gly domain-containing protein n=1 Tax=Macrostomum lignano TaxID=282301 RepID=A0A1I8FYU8_9PLAT
LDNRLQSQLDELRHQNRQLAQENEQLRRPAASGYRLPNLGAAASAPGLSRDLQDVQTRLAESRDLLGRQQSLIDQLEAGFDSPPQQRKRPSTAAGIGTAAAAASSATSPEVAALRQEIGRLRQLATESQQRRPEVDDLLRRLLEDSRGKDEAIRALSAQVDALKASRHSQQPSGADDGVSQDDGLRNRVRDLLTDWGRFQGDLSGQLRPYGTAGGPSVANSNANTAAAAAASDSTKNIHTQTSPLPQACPEHFFNSLPYFEGPRLYDEVSDAEGLLSDGKGRHTTVESGAFHQQPHLQGEPSGTSESANLNLRSCPQDQDRADGQCSSMWARLRSANAGNEAPTAQSQRQRAKRQSRRSFASSASPSLPGSPRQSGLRDSAGWHSERSLSGSPARRPSSRSKAPWDRHEERNDSDETLSGSPRRSRRDSGTRRRKVPKLNLGSEVGSHGRPLSAEEAESRSRAEQSRLEASKAPVDNLGFRVPRGEARHPSFESDSGKSARFSSDRQAREKQPRSSLRTYSQSEASVGESTGTVRPTGANRQGELANEPAPGRGVRRREGAGSGSEESRSSRRPSELGYNRRPDDDAFSDRDKTGSPDRHPDKPSHANSSDRTLDARDSQSASARDKTLYKQRNDSHSPSNRDQSQGERFVDSQPTSARDRSWDQQFDQLGRTNSQAGSKDGRRTGEFENKSNAAISRDGYPDQRYDGIAVSNRDRSPDGRTNDGDERYNDSQRVRGKHRFKPESEGESQSKSAKDGSEDLRNDDSLAVSARDQSRDRWCDDSHPASARDRSEERRYDPRPVGEIDGQREKLDGSFDSSDRDRSQDKRNEDSHSSSSRDRLQRQETGETSVPRYTNDAKQPAEMSPGDWRKGQVKLDAKPEAGHQPKDQSVSVSPRHQSKPSGQSLNEADKPAAEVEFKSGETNSRLESPIAQRDSTRQVDAKSPSRRRDTSRDSDGRRSRNEKISGKYSGPVSASRQFEGGHESDIDRSARYRDGRSTPDLGLQRTPRGKQPGSSVTEAGERKPPGEQPSADNRSGQSGTDSDIDAGQKQKSRRSSTASPAGSHPEKQGQAQSSDPSRSRTRDSDGDRSEKSSKTARADSFATKAASTSDGQQRKGNLKSTSMSKPARSRSGGSVSPARRTRWEDEEQLKAERGEVPEDAVIAASRDDLNVGASEHRPDFTHRSDAVDSRKRPDSGSNSTTFSDAETSPTSSAADSEMASKNLGKSIAGENSEKPQSDRRKHNKGLSDQDNESPSEASTVKPWIETAKVLEKVQLGYEMREFRLQVLNRIHYWGKLVKTGLNYQVISNELKGTTESHARDERRSSESSASDAEVARHAAEDAKQKPLIRLEEPTDSASSGGDAHRGKPSSFREGSSKQHENWRTPEHGWKEGRKSEMEPDNYKNDSNKEKKDTRGGGEKGKFQRKEKSVQTKKLPSMPDADTSREGRPVRSQPDSKAALNSDNLATFANETRPDDHQKGSTESGAPGASDSGQLRQTARLGDSRLNQPGGIDSNRSLDDPNSTIMPESRVESLQQMAAVLDKAASGRANRKQSGPTRTDASQEDRSPELPIRDSGAIRVKGETYFTDQSRTVASPRSPSGQSVGGEFGTHAGSGIPVPLREISPFSTGSEQFFSGSKIPTRLKFEQKSSSKDSYSKDATDGVDHSQNKAGDDAVNSVTTVSSAATVQGEFVQEDTSIKTRISQPPEESLNFSIELAPEQRVRTEVLGAQGDAKSSENTQMQSARQQALELGLRGQQKLLKGTDASDSANRPQSQSADNSSSENKSEDKFDRPPSWAMKDPSGTSSGRSDDSPNADRSDSRRLPAAGRDQMSQKLAQADTDATGNLEEPEYSDSFTEDVSNDRTASGTHDSGKKSSESGPDSIRHRQESAAENTFQPAVAAQKPANFSRNLDADGKQSQAGGRSESSFEADKRPSQPGSASAARGPGKMRARSSSESEISQQHEPIFVRIAVNDRRKRDGVQLCRSVPNLSSVSGGGEDLGSRQLEQLAPQPMSPPTGSRDASEATSMLTQSAPPIMNPDMQQQRLLQQDLRNTLSDLDDEEFEAFVTGVDQIVSQIRAEAEEPNEPLELPAIDTRLPDPGSNRLYSSDSEANDVCGTPSRAKILSSLRATRQNRKAAAAAAGTEGSSTGASASDAEGSGDGDRQRPPRRRPPQRRSQSATSRSSEALGDSRRSNPLRRRTPQPSPMKPPAPLPSQLPRFSVRVRPDNGGETAEVKSHHPQPGTDPTHDALIEAAKQKVARIRGEGRRAASGGTSSEDDDTLKDETDDSEAKERAKSNGGNQTDTDISSSVLSDEADKRAEAPKPTEAVKSAKVEARSTASVLLPDRPRVVSGKCQPRLNRLESRQLRLPRRIGPDGFLSDGSIFSDDDNLQRRRLAARAGRIHLLALESSFETLYDPSLQRSDGLSVGRDSSRDFRLSSSSASENDAVGGRRPGRQPLVDLLEAAEAPSSGGDNGASSSPSASDAEVLREMELRNSKHQLELLQED